MVKEGRTMISSNNNNLTTSFSLSPPPIRATDFRRFEPVYEGVKEVGGKKVMPFSRFGNSSDGGDRRDR